MFLDCCEKMILIFYHNRCLVTGLNISFIYRSVHIVAFGNERGCSEDDQQSSLIWTYLGRSALVSETDSCLLLNSANYFRNPSFTEYQARVFGNVRLVVHDCPIWVRDCSMTTD